MDVNTLFTIGVPAAVLGTMIYRRIVKRPVKGNALDALPLAALAAAEANGKPIEATLSLAQVIAHLNDKRDDIPHWFGVGGTGAGKSTFARLVLAPRIARGEQFVIITGNRSAVFADLPSIGRDATDEDGKLRFDTARETFKQLSRELARRDNTPIKSRTFTTLNVVIDDATILLAQISEAADFLRDAALLGREIDIRLIVMLGSLLVRELGWEGRGDLREHFAVVTFKKQLDGTRTTTLRPRFDDKAEVPFDASPAKDIAPRLKIDPTRVWKPVRDPNEELADLLGPSVRSPGAEIAPQDADGRTDDEDDAARDSLIKHLKAKNTSRDDIREALTAARFKISNKRLSQLLNDE
jgi:hypothetical protein